MSKTSDGEAKAKMPPALVLIEPAGAISDIVFSAGSCCGPVRGGVSISSDHGRGGGVLSQEQARELHEWLGRVIEAIDAGWTPTLPDWLSKKAKLVRPSRSTPAQRGEGQ